MTAPHEHHVHEKQAVTDCPECVEAATAFLTCCGGVQFLGKCDSDCPCPEVGEHSH